MESMVPEHLLAEQCAVEAEIRRAFAGVSRAGGVSWGEAAVLDDYGIAEKLAAARALDCEQGWEELVDDPNWDEEPGIGGFYFLDAIGFAYYLAPAMVRCVRRADVFDDLALRFDLPRERSGSRFERISRDQAKAIGRFLGFMAAVSEAMAMEGGVADDAWREARDEWAEWVAVEYGLR